MREQRDFSVLRDNEQEVLESMLNEEVKDPVFIDEDVLSLLASDKYANHGENKFLNEIRSNIPALGGIKKNQEVGKLETLVKGWQRYRGSKGERKWVTGSSARRMLIPTDPDISQEAYMLDENFLTNILDGDIVHFKYDLEDSDRINSLKQANELAKDGDRPINYVREVNPELNLQALDKMAETDSEILIPDVVPENWLKGWDCHSCEDKFWKAFLKGEDIEKDYNDSFYSQMLYRGRVLGVLEDIGDYVRVPRNEKVREDARIYHKACEEGAAVITLDMDFYGSDPFPRIEGDTQVVLPQVAYGTLREREREAARPVLQD